MGNIEEKKVGVAGLQPNTFLHDYRKLQTKNCSDFAPLINLRKQT